MDGVSPVLLRKVVYAGSNNPSFGRAAHDLRVLAEVSVAIKQVERLTKRIGQERHEERDAATVAWLERPLMQREDPPSDAAVASLAVVEMDGGRLQIRPLPAERDEVSAASEQGIAAGVASTSAAVFGLGTDCGTGIRRSLRRLRRRWLARHSRGQRCQTELPVDQPTEWYVRG